MSRKHVKPSPQRLWPVALAVVLLFWCGLPQRAGAVQDGVQKGVQGGAGFVRPASITVVSDDNYPPYIFRNGEGRIQGILVDQWKAWEKATGVRVDLQAMDWEAAQRTMRAGRADVIDTIFYNDTRAKIYDFSKPYAQLDVPVFFHKGLGGITDAKSLRGFTIGVKAGDAVIDVLGQYGIRSLREFDSYEDIINAARAGEIRVFSIDAPPALYYLYKHDLATEFRQAFVLYSGAFHRAVKKGDTGLLALVEQGFAAIPPSTLEAINEKWLGTPIVTRYNLRLVFIIFCGIAAVTLALAFLNIVLRRRVRAKVAELNATLAELGTSEERFRTIFNSVSDLIFIHTWPDGRTVDVNQRACEVYGYTREEMLGLPVESTSAGYEPYDQAHAMELLRRAYEGVPQVAEWLARRRDGVLFWVEVSIRRALVLGQERILVSCRDIDERKRAEESLLAKTAMLEAQTNASLDGILVVNEKRERVLTNQKVLELLNIPANLFETTEDGPFLEHVVSITKHPGRFLEKVNHLYRHPGETSRDEIELKNGTVLDRYSGPILSHDGVTYGRIWTFRDITERKKAEEALLESRERLQLALDAANDGLWDWRVDTGETYFSPRCYTLLGFQPGEFPADFASFAKLLHPDDLASINTAAETLLSETETNAIELRMRAKSGEWKWILTRSRVVDRDASGAPVRLAGTGTDITGRKQAEEALGRKDALLRAMLRNLPFDFWARDTDQRVIMQSDESIRLWGDLRADPLAVEGIDPETQAAWEDANSRVLEGEAVSGEREFAMPDGERRIFHDIVAPIREGEAVLGILGVNIDITESKRSELALRESEERYRTLFEQSLDAIAIQEGLPPVFSWVNPAFCELFGYGPEELYALTAEDLWRLVHPEDRDLVRESLTARMNGRQDEARYAFRILRKDGTVRWVDVTGRRMRQGGKSMNLSIYRDTTERKMFEEALTQARDAAEAANRAKSEFLANMSHEIRTPLNGIVGMIQLLDGSPLTGEQKRHAQAAIQSSQRLTNLLGDILDLSRIEARKFVLLNRPFVLRDILDSVEMLYRFPAAQKGVELSLSLDPDLPEWLLGDDHRLRQVLSNLVGNAVKFTPSGEILVEAQRLKPWSEEHCRVLFVVSDTGMGIPPELLDQTFQMFTQVEGSLSRRHQGAGLGLAIVRHLVSLLGGPGIDVSSEVGQGTAFSFVLPFGMPAPGAIPEGVSAGGQLDGPSGDKPEASSLAGLRVLLVEDEEINQLALRTGLERRGLLVTCASDGKAALAALRAEAFDCVLMDIQMPGMNGLEATLAIRTKPEFKDCADIPVIALTAFAMVGDRERFLAAGMDDYLAKPFSFEDLARILRRIRASRLDTTE